MDDVFCPKCGTKNEGGSKFCLSCGCEFPNALNGAINPQSAKTAPMPASVGVAKPPKQKSGSFISIILIAVAACIVLACAGLFCMKFFNSSKQNAMYPGVFYIKNGTLKFNKYGKSNPEKIVDVVEEGDTLSGYSDYFVMSDDGKYILFPTENDGDPILWYMKASNREPVKIGASSEQYSFADNKTVVYIDPDSTLYKYDFEDREKIDKDVSYYEVDYSGKNIIWIDNEKNLYYRPLSLKKDEEKIDKNVTEIVYAGKSSDKIVYAKTDFDGTNDLYLTKNFKEPEKIASDVTNFFAGEDEGKIFVYYTKDSGSESTSALDFIDDDYPDDANMTEPDIDDYTTTVVKDSYWGYKESEEVSDEYYARMADYNEKLTRDYLRDSIRSTPINLIKSDLYFYCEEKDDAEKIESGAIKINACDNTNYSPEIIFGMSDINSAKKTKLSDLYSEFVATGTYSFDVDGILESCSDEYVAYKNQVSAIKTDERIKGITKATFSKERRKAYAFGYGDDGKLFLYAISISDKNLGEANKVDEDVYASFGIHDGYLYYLANYDSNTLSGDLYADGVLVDEDVFCSPWSSSDDGVFVYFKGYDRETYSVDEAYVCDGTKSKKVAKDVYYMHVYGDNKIAFLTDYSKNDKTGTLKLYVGKEDLIKIDTDVSEIVY